MSDEFTHVPESDFTPFWPMLILVLGFLLWFGFADFQLNSQRSFLQKELEEAQPALKDSQNIKDAYVKLMNDVLQTSQKDAAAAQIVKDAINAGLIHVQQNTATAGTTPTPAPAPAAPSK